MPLTDKLIAASFFVFVMIFLHLKVAGTFPIFAWIRHNLASQDEKTEELQAFLLIVSWFMLLNE